MFRLLIETSPGGDVITMTSVTDFFGQAKFPVTSAAGSRGWIYMILNEFQSGIYGTEGVTAYDTNGTPMDVQVVAAGQFNDDDIIRGENCFTVTARPGSLLNFTVYNEPLDTNMPESRGRVEVRNDFAAGRDISYGLTLSEWDGENRDWSPVETKELTGGSIFFMADRRGSSGGEDIYLTYKLNMDNSPDEFIFSFEHEQRLVVDITDILKSVGRVAIALESGNEGGSYNVPFTLTELGAWDARYSAAASYDGTAEITAIDITKSYVLKADGPPGYRQETLGYTVSTDGGEPIFVPASFGDAGLEINFADWPALWSVDIELVVRNELSVYALEFTTLDPADKSPVQGVRYMLYEEGGSASALSSQISGNDGYVRFENLNAGAVYRMEQLPPQGYVRDYAVFYITYGDTGGEPSFAIGHESGAGGKAVHKSDFYPSALTDWVILNTKPGTLTNTLDIIAFSAVNPRHRLGDVFFEHSYQAGMHAPPQSPSRVSTGANGELSIVYLQTSLRHQLTALDGPYGNALVTRVNGEVHPPAPLEDFVIDFRTNGVPGENGLSITLEISFTRSEAR